MNYTADEQRQRVRATDGKTTVWGKPPALIRAEYTTGEGDRGQSLLLVSGWWSVARHFHYVPEILLALTWTLPAGFTHALPYFYVVYLTILLVDRAGRDDLRCQQKYGTYWAQYCRRVPSKIIPGIYSRRRRATIGAMAKRTVYDGQIAVADADYTHPTEDDEGELVEAEIDGLDAPVTARAALRFRLELAPAPPFEGEVRGNDGGGGVSLRQIIDAVRAAYRAVDRESVVGLCIETIELDDEAGTLEIVVGG